MDSETNWILFALWAAFAMVIAYCLAVLLLIVLNGLSLGFLRLWLIKKFQGRPEAIDLAWDSSILAASAATLSGYISANLGKDGMIQTLVEAQDLKGAINGLSVLLFFLILLFTRYLSKVSDHLEKLFRDWYLKKKTSSDK